MLTYLLIKDYALIEKIEIEFGSGLNIITGETGAGKSILIGAMGLLLGERASTSIVRKGSKKSIIEGIFHVEGNSFIESMLKSYDVEPEAELIIRREISLKGTNRCFINDTPVSLNVIKEAGNLLVDLHGQHEHQSLLRTETHIDFIDEYCGLDSLLSDYSLLISGLNNLKREYSDLIKSKAALQEKRELYLFQLKEIDNISPLPGEDEKLERELVILENSEKLQDLTAQIYSELFESDSAVYDSLDKIHNDIALLSSIDKQFIEKEKEVASALTILSDVAGFIRSYRDNIDHDPNSLEEFRQRSGAINLLKKKYGGTIESVLEYKNKILSVIETAENFDERINAILSEINAYREKAGKLADKISGQRMKNAHTINEKIKNILAYLGINDAVFEIKFSKTLAESDSDSFLIAGGKQFKYNSKGIDNVEFFISTNLGESIKPLNKVASGGEISRIMLALKTVLAQNEKLPLLIFDEIDTGISGRIAQKVGKAIKNLASHHQIIAITHLPQIAGFADHHFSVEKIQHDSRVTSSIRKLTHDERIEEIAKLLSGENLTRNSLESARELIKQS